jgi:oligopeptide transport system substrate-binding protein
MPDANGAMQRRLRAATALAVAISLLSGCSRTPEAERLQGAAGSTDSNTLLLGNGPGPDSLDPQKARVSEAHEVLRDLYECLTSLDKQAAPAPGVATSWDTSADGRTYTFHLRPQARWSNGDRVVAADFLVALRRLVDPATASQYAQVIDVVANARAIIAGKEPVEALGVAAPDDATVVITLAGPAPYLPGLLSHPSTCPVHRPTLARYGADFARPGIMVSNGAFVLKEWVPGSYVLATRNHNYWNDRATHLDAVKYLQIADENAELTRYRADQLQVTAVVPRGQFDWIKAHLAQELHIVPQLNTYYYGFNLERAPFRDNPRLRRALSLVIDREKLAARVLRVGELPAYGWVPPGTHDYTPQSFDYRDLPLPQKLAEARQLYAAAGYSPQHPLAIELRYNDGEIHTKLALAVASMWKEALGVETRLVAVEFKSLLQDIDRGDVQIFRSSWVGDYNDAYTFAQYLKSDFGINLPRYKNPSYDKLLGQAAAEVNVATRRALLEQAERLMLADHPLMPLYFYVNKHLVKPNVTGWYDNVMNVVYSKDLGLAPPPPDSRSR